MISDIALEFAEKLSIEGKIDFLNSIPRVKYFYEKIESRFTSLPLAHELVLKELIAIEQFPAKENSDWDLARLEALLEKLVRIDAFYEEIGGIIGYQRQILTMLQRVQRAEENEQIAYHPPSCIDISQETKEVWEGIFAGISSLPLMSEMVPLGGAADRLHLIDENTGSELPAARLPFAGRPLLSMIIRDLQAREYLHYKLYGNQVITPLALMTSEEKENDRHIRALLEENDWFGRPRESIRQFMQPLVPVVSETGDWCWIGPFKPLMKPGGHGAIWKLARDQGIFDWFEKLGRKKALIRQINNPIAGIDYGLLGFTGIGVEKDMVFGFASCPRQLNAAEGVNVLLEKIMQGKSKIVLTNVEYCDFAKAGIEHLLQEEGARFSSNTNILFADLSALAKAVERCPYPGLLINLKKIGFTTESGERVEKPLARLESTMQNIADVFVEEKGNVLNTQNTFVTYNHRNKTISTAKKAYVIGNSAQETPEKCFFDLLQTNRELLQSRCQWDVPERRSLEEYLAKGPDSVFLYHPALGPLYSIIEQKIRGGRLALGSEMQLEIADLDCEALDVEGSLLIHADQVMGHLAPLLTYSEKTGRCLLKNVIVRNRGVDWSKSNPFWKNCFERKEALEIVLKGHSEFIAEDVTFRGNIRFEVEDGIRMRVVMQNGELFVSKEKIDPAPFWNYTQSEKIALRRGY